MSAKQIHMVAVREFALKGRTYARGERFEAEAVTAAAMLYQRQARFAERHERGTIETKASERQAEAVESREMTTSEGETEPTYGVRKDEPVDVPKRGRRRGSRYEREDMRAEE